MFYDDSGRSRGGHSYNIGQTVGRMAGKLFKKIYGSRKNENPKLFEINKRIQEISGRIMGYSHDLGHTPLGHDGEYVLDKKLGDLTSKDSALRAEVEEQRRKDFAGVKITVVDEETNIDDKNIAYEKIQKLEENKGKEEKIVSLIKEKLGFDTYVEIKNAKVNVVVSNKEHSYKIANDIIKLVSSSFDSDKSVTVKFQ